MFVWHLGFEVFALLAQNELALEIKGLPAYLLSDSHQGLALAKQQLRLR